MITEFVYEFFTEFVYEFYIELLIEVVLVIVVVIVFTTKQLGDVFINRTKRDSYYYLVKIE